ncbi:hypothetical protein J4217_01595 [Candidatus Pacearchaeota archaeon]|nr:hypothetical protein [Candidatus Pacearchaeota archaeon]
MKYYQLLKRQDFRNLRLCIDNYTPDFLFIRECGGTRPDGSYRIEGMQKVSIKLGGKRLDFKKNKNGLYILVDNKEVFHFPLEPSRYYKGFSLAYERIIPADNGVGRRVRLSTGINPYDPELPEPRRSFLRTVLDDHLMEIFFEGLVHLKFHSWWIRPHFKYWQVDRNRPKQK